MVVEIRHFMQNTPITRDVVIERGIRPLRRDDRIARGNHQANQIPQ